jgi:hypothetical protein
VLAPALAAVLLAISATTTRARVGHFGPGAAQ